MPRRAKAAPAPDPVTQAITTAVEGEELTLTPEEIAAIKAARVRATTQPSAQPLGAEDLIQAFIKAIESTRPFTKKTVMDRKKNTPWTPTDGSPKITKFKRPMFHHGIEIDPNKTYNDVCLMLDKVKPGIYCGGYVKVVKRKDGGFNIDYPIRTASQRLRLTSQFGIRSFKELVQRLLDERADPKKYKPQDEDED